MYMTFTDLYSIHTELKAVVGYHTKIGHFHNHIKVIGHFSFHTISIEWSHDFPNSQTFVRVFSHLSKYFTFLIWNSVHSQCIADNVNFAVDKVC